VIIFYVSETVFFRGWVAGYDFGGGDSSEVYLNGLLRGCTFGCLTYEDIEADWFDETSYFGDVLSNVSGTYWACSADCLVSFGGVS